MSKLFSDIYGHKNAVSIMTAQLESDKLSHGYVIYGNEGTGRNYLALEFARYILCSRHTDDDCQSCRLFLAGSHPDFIYLDGTEGIRIESVREAIERVNLSPNISAKKVLLLSKSENMGIEAANALLKTLEEPPADSIVILTAVSEKSLPETIVSRAQKIKLTPLSGEDMKKILAKEFSAPEISNVIDFARGSVGEAKKLIEDSKDRECQEAFFSDVDVLYNSKSIVEKFKIVEKYDKKKELKKFFDIFAGVSFSLLEDELNETNDRGNNVDRLTLLAISNKILKIYADLDYNVSLRLALEALIIEYLTYN